MSKLLEPGVFVNLLQAMLGGLGTTLALFFLTLLFALPLGLLLALGRMSKHKVVSKLVEWFILIIRGTPLILQIVVVYFLPSYIFQWIAKQTGLAFFNDIKFDRFVMCVVAFVINYSCYFAEIFRGGIKAIPRGQYEAGKVLGFTRQQVFFKIILPQVVKHILPPISNEVINLVKDSALAQVIGIVDLFRVGQSYQSKWATTMPLFFAGAFYLIMNGVIAKCFKFFEKKLSYYK